MNALDRLQNHVDEVPGRLALQSVDELTRKLPGKWSRKEILGHLIDSAINNLKRFTDAQFADAPYSVQAYNQDQLVIVNQYQALPTKHLLMLWQSLNRQIIYVAKAIPAETLARPIYLSDSTERTLGWLIDDYVAHLEHHLKTLF